jgi:uncharacterized membrane protein (UPF0127 family)
VHRLDTEAGVRHLGWIIAAVGVLAVTVFIGRGGSQPADPALGGPTTTTAVAAGARGIPGFDSVAFTVTGNSGTRTFCGALASTPSQRAQGLMARRDLGGYDAMVFRFDADTDTTFYMRNTPLPLSIAWFDAGGRFVSGTDMTPCPDRPGCPDYAAVRPYRVAVEVPKGGLGALGIGPGSSISLAGGCR